MHWTYLNLWLHRVLAPTLPWQNMQAAWLRAWLSWRTPWHMRKLFDDLGMSWMFSCKHHYFYDMFIMSLLALIEPPAKRRSMPWNELTRRFVRSLLPQRQPPCQRARMMQNQGAGRSLSATSAKWRPVMQSCGNAFCWSWPTARLVLSGTFYVCPYSRVICRGVMWFDLRYWLSSLAQALMEQKRIESGRGVPRV